MYIPRWLAGFSISFFLFVVESSTSWSWRTLRSPVINLSSPPRARLQLVSPLGVRALKK